MRIASSLLAAVFASVALGIALAFAFGGMSPLPAWLALAGGIATGAFAFRGMPREETPAPRPHPVEWALIGLFAFVSLRAFLWLLFIENRSYHILSPNNLGDLVLHIDFIHYLASGVKFWPDSPIFIGEPLKYPVGGDFINSLLLLAGLPLEQGLVWVGLAGSALTLAALWRWGRGFAIAAFLFGGGLTAFAIFAEPSAIGHSQLFDYQAEQAWKNPFLALFVTQRGLLFALPAGLLLLDYWRARYLRRERGLLPEWVALLLYAGMPLFNVHAFLYLSIALAGMFAFAPNPDTRRESIRFVALAFLPAALCAALVTGGFSAGGGVHWQLGWIPAEEKGSVPWIWFWLRNFGLYLVLSIALLVLAIVRGPREVRAIVVPAALMFVVCGFVNFAPWWWDNTKLFIWCWLAVAPCLWSELLRPSPLLIRVPVCIVLFFTGAVSLTAGLDGRHNYGLLDSGIVRQSARAIKNFPADARFAIQPEYNHPILFLGRKVALGYAGHLMSHGMTYNGRNADKLIAFQNFMMGGPGWENDARELGVDYLYWGEHEGRAFPGSLKPWEQALPVVAQGDTFKIYALPKR
jgi:hypothetical protein